MRLRHTTGFRHLLSVRWREKTPNTECLPQTACPERFTNHASRRTKLIATQKRLVRFAGYVMFSAIAALCPFASSWAQQGGFHVEEASISDIQNAIKSGQTSCKQVVQAYLARAKAYN